MDDSNNVSGNLIEIIPYIEQGDFRTAHKHLTVYANLIENNMRKAKGLSGVAPPPSDIIADIKRDLAAGRGTSRITIQKLKDFDAKYTAFVSSIPSYKRNNL